MFHIYILIFAYFVPFISNLFLFNCMQQKLYLISLPAQKLNIYNILSL